RKRSPSRSPSRLPSRNRSSSPRRTLPNRAPRPRPRAEFERGSGMGLRGPHAGASISQRRPESPGARRSRAGARAHQTTNAGAPKPLSAAWGGNGSDPGKKWPCHQGDIISIGAGRSWPRFRFLSMDPFVHLHVHSDYSLLDGACDVTKLVNLAKLQGMEAVALTDHGNLFGAWSFHAAARAAGIKPILGCELYICKNEDHRQRPESGSAVTGTKDGYNHLIVLCENDTGYRNLAKIVSEASLHGFYYKPRISKKFLAEHSAGLIGLSACLKGEVQEFLSAGRPREAERVAAEFRDIFGSGNFFLEIQDQGLEQEHRIKDAILDLARRTGLDLVATNDCHYLGADDARMHDVLLCIQTGKRVNDEQRMRFGSDQFFLKTGE